MLTAAGLKYRYTAVYGMHMNVSKGRDTIHLRRAKPDAHGLEHGDPAGKSQLCHVASRYYQELTPATVTQLRLGHAVCNRPRPRWHGSKNAGRLVRISVVRDLFGAREVLAYSLNASQMSDESGPKRARKEELCRVVIATGVATTRTPPSFSS